MAKIATYVFFDIETTGLPFHEKNRTKIIEASFLGVPREEIEKAPKGTIPPLSKLSFVLNPMREIHPEVTAMTGLSNNSLKNAPKFNQRFKTLSTFLEDLEKPVCLVAHNGNSFDYKILLAECLDANVILPEDLLCVDSLIGFRKILKNASVIPKVTSTVDDLLTDDEDDEWPNLNISSEDWEKIDIAESPSGKNKKSLEDQRDDVIKAVFTKKTEKSSLKLTDLYTKLVNKPVVNAHRAEADCFMLLECVIALKEEFLNWSNDACKKISLIKPLTRY